MVWNKIVVILGIVAVGNTPAFAQTFGMVNYEKVVSAHPRMAAYDPGTHRFRNSSSQPQTPEEIEKQIAQLTKEIEHLNAQEKSLLDSLKKGLSSRKNSEESSETVYWNNKQENERKRELLRQRLGTLYDARQIGGRTPDISILPEVKQISGDVDKAIKAAASARGCGLVFAAPEPRIIEGASREASPAVINNEYSRFVREQGSEKGREALVEWLKNCRRNTGAVFPKTNLLKPVLIGGVDITDDVLRLLTPVSGGSSK